MPEPTRISEAQIKRITDAAYKILKQEGCMTFSGLMSMHKRLKRAILLEDNCKIADADWQKIYSDLYDNYPGVAIRTGNGVAAGLKNRIYDYKETLVMDTNVPIITKPTGEERRKMVAAMVEVMQRHKQKADVDTNTPPLSWGELKQRAAVIVAFTFADTPPSNWSVTMAMAKLQGVIKNESGMVAYIPGGIKRKKRKGTQKGKETAVPPVEGQEKVPAQITQPVRSSSATALSLEFNGIHLTFEPNGTITVSGPKGKKIQVSSNDPLHLAELTVVSLSVSG